MQLRATVLARYFIFAAGMFWIGKQLGFDIFSSTMFACSGIFFALFADYYWRYRRSVGVGRAGERSVAALLADLGVEALHDIYFPTPHGSTQIDHVMLFPGSLAVLETKTYNGWFRMPWNGPWQRIGRYGRAYAIANPLNQLDAAQRTLALHLPTTRIWGLVILAGNHRAIDGLPPNVKSLDGLRGYILQHRQQHGEWQYSAETKKAWQELQTLKIAYAGLAKTHVRDARKKRGERFYSFEETFPLWLFGSLSTLSALLTILAYRNII